MLKMAPRDYAIHLLKIYDGFPQVALDHLVTETWKDAAVGVQYIKEVTAWLELHVSGDWDYNQS